MIEISNLKKNFGAVRALNGVTFSVKKGEILGLLGPNGAGKTTTMRIITGYFPASSGSVIVDGMNVDQDALKIKQLIGYLPEFAPLYADMVVYDYLQYVAAVRHIKGNDRSKRIKLMTELCGLNDIIHRPFRELSRGNKQRVGLAHAMISDPEILILDEPTSGLDPNQISTVRSIIKEIGREKTVIFSTHILSEAESTCDRIVIINDGRVVADGTADSVKTRELPTLLVRLALLDAPIDKVQEILLSVPPVNKVQRNLEVVSTISEAVVFDVFCNPEGLRDVYSAIKKQDWILVGMNTEGQSLEDTFKELTGKEQAELNYKTFVKSQERYND